MGTRAGRSVLAAAFGRRLEFIAANRKPIAFFAAGWTALVLMESLLLRQISPLIAAFALGLGVAFGGWTIAWYLNLDGQHFVRLGAWAEQWTAELMAKGSTASIFDDVPFGVHNVDHVLVSSDGIFVVETKWKSTWRGAMSFASTSTSYVTISIKFGPTRRSFSRHFLLSK